MADLFDLLAPALAPMDRNQQIASALDPATDAFVRAAPSLRVDGCVAGDPDFACRDAFADEGGMRALGRRKVKARQASNHLPEPFFRKRSTEVIRAKPRLDMCDRNSVVECGQRPLKCALRVPLHHDLQRLRELTRGYSGKVDHRIAVQCEPIKGKLASLVTFGDP